MGFPTDVFGEGAFGEGFFGGGPDTSTVQALGQSLGKTGGLGVGGQVIRDPWTPIGMPVGYQAELHERIRQILGGGYAGP